MTQQPAVAEYGSWTSPLTPEEFGKGNCGRIGELRVHKGEGDFLWAEGSVIHSALFCAIFCDCAIFVLR